MFIQNIEMNITQKYGNMKRTSNTACKSNNKRQKFFYMNLKELQFQKTQNKIFYGSFEQQHQEELKQLKKTSNIVHPDRMFKCLNLNNDQKWKKCLRAKTQFQNRITSHSKRNINKIRAIQSSQKHSSRNEQKKQQFFNLFSQRSAIHSKIIKLATENSQQNKKNTNNFLCVQKQQPSKKQQKISICCPGDNKNIKLCDQVITSYRSRFSESEASFRYIRQNQDIDQLYEQAQLLEHNPNNENVGKVKIIQQFAEGSNSKIYKAILSTYTNTYSSKEIILKKVLINDQHINREQFFVKRLKNPYLVQFLGTYTTIVNQKKPIFSEEQQQQDSQQHESKYLNILMEKYEMNLGQLLKTSRLPPQTRKIYLYQMLRSLVYLHALNICHRDIKPQNFLIKKWKIVITDFGMSKIIKNKSNRNGYGNEENEQKNTSYVFQRQYRAPELLLNSQNYTKCVDIWALGCLAAQMLLSRPLFSGVNNLDQIVKIMKVLGSPKWSTLSFCKDRTPNLPNIIGIGLDQTLRGNNDKQFVNLVEKMLQFDPKNRITALQALCSPYFDDLREQTIYRKIFKEYNCPNFYDFSKRQIYGNEQFLGKLVPFWIKEHCRKYRIKISQIKKL